ncbi:restriction endonuclease subunit S [Tetragenococcus koreensis]|uniref:Type I restriction endonuclease subunit S n=1 Tax=Tetragenococcus koreensis TaxID=290335 RepID=A0AAN4UB44_9ENTE|nr:restriction endonuclease subunit S [Tetragenococcus koreensis]AYW46788.1 restriction endonuclease subunit M [Tetragenococcus koreensis]MCF1625976.1 restriction endonuclease subunit S [Tetragenococcus koreensis]MCF1631263.1 restriction endonuclease subunit S [Tetragenococcus koreensis]MCF1677249.1 restriction endonuclease subunit S [Tetragenococcus koreensis]MDN6250548.1 restriction endonuclease subunit S [Tetragenococcus koreensis]
MEKMIKNLVKFTSGSPQFRINESFLVEAPIYLFYDQSDLAEDLVDLSLDNTEKKRVHTLDELSTLRAGDVVFSLISGKAAIVRSAHEDYLYTQNYIKLVPKKELDSRFLVYLLNEDKQVRRQFQKGIQGSATMKYTVKQLKELVMPTLPNLEKQKKIGSIYFKQLRKQALKERVAELETKALLAKLEEEKHE